MGIRGRLQPHRAGRPLVQTRLSVTDISAWAEVGRAHLDVFTNAPPVTTMVEVRGLVDPEMLIEVEAIAYPAD